MKTTKNVTDLSTVELKALAYDILCDIELFNKNLKIVNQELEKRQSEVPVETITPEKVEELKTE